MREIENPEQIVNNDSLIADCRLCRSGDEYRPSFDVPVFETPSYYAIASLGGFIPGWTLLCSREHRLNLSADYADPALHEALALATRCVSEEFGPCVLFEHGCVDDLSATSCGTAHAHLHVVPFGHSLTQLVEPFDTGLTWSSIAMSAIESVARQSEYLFACDRYNGPDSVGLLARLRVPRSQFFRRVIADSMGVQHLANYRHAPLPSLAAGTAFRLRLRMIASEPRAA